MHMPCGHTHMKKEEKGTNVCVCVNIVSMGTAVDCVVLCGHDLFVSVVLM